MHIPSSLAAWLPQAALALAFTAASDDAVASQVISCSSMAPSAYVECPAGGLILGARLDEEASITPFRCAFGQTWGYHGNVIWVAAGCGGEFEVDLANGP